MLDTNDILETIQMITDENLDVRTVTMGISLLDCADADPKAACEKIYRKITTRAKDLVKTADEISEAYGMPIVNKRISCLLYTSAGGALAPHGAVHVRPGPPRRALGPSRGRVPIVVRCVPRAFCRTGRRGS